MKWKLREHMDRNNDTMEGLAEHLGITYQTLSKKMNGHVDFTLTELRRIKDRYSLSAEQFYNIFLGK